MADDGSTSDIPLVSQNHDKRAKLYTDELQQIAIETGAESALNEATAGRNGQLGDAAAAAAAGTGAAARFRGALSKLASADDPNELSRRLNLRKQLFTRRRRCATASFVLAILGILMMIVNQEVAMATNRKLDTGQLILKICISTTTILLLVSICYYHYLDVKIDTLANKLDDWTVGFDWVRILRVLTELLICSIHPMPGLEDNVHFVRIRNKTQEIDYMGATDVFLSVPMFFRCYLFARYATLNSSLYNSISSRSLGALNRVQIDAKFIMRVVLNRQPVIVMVFLMLIVLTISTWSLRLCESQMNDNKAESMLDYAWLTCITFLTIGYGDLYPHTYCGRSIAVLTGMFGAGCTALVVTVVMNKLELSNSERAVLDFLTKVDLEKDRRHAAANVVRECWKTFKWQNFSGLKNLLHRQKLRGALQKWTQVKSEQRRIADQSPGLLEIYRTQKSAGEDMEKMLEKLEETDGRMRHIEDSLTTVQLALLDIQSRLAKTP